MKAKWIVTGALAIAALSALALSGCSSEPSYDIVLGDKDNAANEMTVQNSTGQEITSVKVAVTGSEDSDEYLNDGTWEADKTALLCVPEIEMPVSDVPAEEGNDAADVELRDTFDITLTTGDSTEYTLHQVSVEGMKDVKNAAVCISDGGLAYLTYTEDDNEVSTLEAETAIKEQADAEAKAAEEAAAAEAAAKAQAEAEAKAAEEAAAKAAAQKASSSNSSSSSSKSSSASSSSSNSSSSKSSSSGSSSSGSSSSGSSGSGNVSQDEDVCIDPDDVVLRD